MIILGASWIVFVIFLQVLKIELVMAALITGALFVILGALYGERPWQR